MTLPRKNRITTREFKRFLRKGRRIRGEVCSLQYGPIHGAVPKVAVVVPVRTEPSAVQRNRIRRKIVEVVAEFLPELKAPMFLIVRIHRGGEVHVSVCKKELDTMLRKSGIISR
jgi:ribonuclease P protein component